MAAVNLLLRQVPDDALERGDAGDGRGDGRVVGVVQEAALAELRHDPVARGRLEAVESAPLWPTGPSSVSGRNSLSV